jgi:energy-converting hydrogenase A subunit M
MGTMILLRKILLWFLIFASPFLAILMPFIFIRNIGWIWIGVFFQWLFYGPLLALFLGAMNAIWTAGIPFNFDFSRVVPFNRVEEGASDSLAGYTYPTGINILYGGPAQINNGVANRGLSAVNNGNYIDTFTEYVISLIMIWAVTFFPWWLLRIFRDLCCDGIYATRNILLAWYNQWSSSQGRPPVPSKVQPQSFPSIKVEAPKVKVVQQQTQVKTKLQSVEQIRSTKTVDVPRAMNIEAKRLTDIAKMETNSSMRDTVKQNLMNLANPAKAETSKERETLMNLRTELFNRSVKKDSVAQRILASTSQSKAEQIRQRQEIVKSIPKLISISASVTAKVKVSEEKSNAVMNKYMQSLAKNNTVVNNISKKTQVPQENVRKVLTSYAQQASQTAKTATQNIATQTNMTVDKVKEVLKEASRNTQRSDVVKKVSSQNQIRKEQVSQIFKAISSSIQKTKEKTLPPTFAPKIAQAMNVPLEKAQSIIKSIQDTHKAVHQQKIESSHVTNITNNQTAVKQIEQKTGMQSEQVKQVMNSYAQNVSQPVSQAIEKIAAETKTGKEKVKEVIKETNNTIKQQQTIQQTAEKENISVAQSEQIMNAVTQVESQDVPEQEQASSHEQVSKDIQVSEEKARSITDTAFQAISNNEELIQNIQEHTGLKKEQIQITLDTFSKNMDKPADELAEEIEESAGVEKEKVQNVMEAIGEDLAGTDDIVDEVAEAEEIDPEEVNEIMSASLPVAAEPEEHIEESVGIPPNIAVEDYEEVRNMWTDQYENGEVPVTENVQARDEWVEQDIIMITNTLNKLMSDDEQMKQEGLDELGFIIPVFMINNLKGEELVVYLKAKLEAAKTVKKQIDMEKRLREEILGEKQKEEEETLLEVDRSEKKEEQKHMAIDLEEQQKEEAAVKERLKKLGEK